jgi:hypothetical protein
MTHHFSDYHAPPTRKADEAEQVNSPDRYTAGGIEVLDYLKAKLTPEEYRGFLRGNALKYLSRAGLKGNASTDYAKAAWYLKQLGNEAAR